MLDNVVKINIDFDTENTKVKFIDIFDLAQIQKLQDSFSRAFEIGAVITEPDGTRITEPSEFCKFCSTVIRNTEIGAKNCKFSDAYMGQPKKDGPRIEKCLSAGLMDCGVSIMIGDVHIASWLVGQVVIEGQDISKLLKYADEIGVDRDTYLNHLKEVKHISSQSFKNICDFLYLIAEQLSKLAEKNFNQAKELRKRNLAEKALEHEKEFFKVTLKSIGEGIITMDTDGNITVLNETAEILTGWKSEEAIGLSIDEVFNIINESSLEQKKIQIKEVLQTGKKMVNIGNIVISKEGQKKNVAHNLYPIKDKRGNIYGLVLTFRDITEELRKQKEILYLSYHDKLTGLYNRAFFEKEVKKLEFQKELPISIIMGDINGLKLANDVFGHSEGDKLLKSISKIFKSYFREQDIICRWGGDEFAVILPRTSKDIAQNICNDMRNACVNNKECKIEPSIALGISTLLDNSQKVSDVIKKAEDRMYRNKLLEAKSNRSGIVASLKRTLFEKSFETEEHAMRLVEMSLVIGEKLNLPESNLDDLMLLAVLHDIGKVAIPDSILNKVEKLTIEEWEEMKKHSEIGFRIVQSSFELSHIAEYILCHHERWDGKGYPQGLKGEVIPLLARIITIVDSYDAMTNTRHYRRKITKEDAIEEIKRCSGSQFDPHLTEIFIQYMENYKI